MPEQTDDPKQRIIDAALSLFGHKGFNATGVREVAREAGVNQAMINYYFGSKVGLLTAVLDRFFDRYEAIATAHLTTDEPLYVKGRAFMQAALRFFRENPELVVIALTELPLAMPEVAAYKAGRLRRMRELLVDKFHAELVELRGEDLHLEIAGPMLISALASHFVFRPVLEQLGWVKIDDAFYEDLERMVPDLIIFGLMGPRGRMGTDGQQ